MPANRPKELSRVITHHSIRHIGLNMSCCLRNNSKEIKDPGITRATMDYSSRHKPSTENTSGILKPTGVASISAQDHIFSLSVRLWENLPIPETPFQTLPRHRWHHTSSLASHSLFKSITGSLLKLLSPFLQNIKAGSNPSTALWPKCFATILVLRLPFISLL